MKPQQLLECNQPRVGRKIRLQRMNPSHLDFLLRSFENKLFWSHYRANQMLALSRAELTAELERDLGLLPAQRGKIEWVIEKLDSKDEGNIEPIGFASLSAIDAAQSQAEFMLGIVEQEQIKTGIALEASLLVLDYAFNHEGLHKLCSFVYGNNPLAQKNTLALGFKNDGVLEKHLQLQTSLDFLDVYQNSLLQEQFRNNRRLSRLSSRLLGVDVTRKPRHRRSDEFDLNASFELKP